jgi:ribosomal protein L11
VTRQSDSGKEINVQIEWIDARLFAFRTTTTTTAPLLDRLTI